MRCLKCGVDTEENRSFCQNCLDGMRECPVPRETPAVILPRPKAEPARSRAPKLEELLADSRKRQKRLVWICALLAVISLSLGCLVFMLLQGEDTHTIGQTYKTYINRQEERP